MMCLPSIHSVYWERFFTNCRTFQTLH